MSEREDGGCPCLHTTPCQPNCTCVNPISSVGCLFCCSYGSSEQQKAKAEWISDIIKGHMGIVEVVDGQ